MAVADTTFLIDVLEGDSGAKGKLLELVGRQEPLWLPAPALHELYYGAGLSANLSRERRRIEELERGLPPIPFDAEAAKQAGLLEADLERSGKRPSRADIQVAAIALARNQAVVTRDKRFPKPAGLELERY